MTHSNDRYNHNTTSRVPRLGDNRRVRMDRAEGRTSVTYGPRSGAQGGILRFLTTFHADAE